MHPSEPAPAAPPARSEPRRSGGAAADPRSIRRTEDGRFLTGRGRFVDDIRPDDAWHAVILRSPHAHAAILGIDASAAAGLDGLAGVFTAADLAADGLGPLPCSSRLDEAAGLAVPPRPALAHGRVRHVGEPVALVVARSRAAAVEAAERVVVDYAPLPCVVDPVRALAPGAPQLWDEVPGNRAFRFRRGDAVATQAALATAAHVVELTLENNRVAAAALEPRGATGLWDRETGRLRLVFSGASVHLVRGELAAVFGLPPDHVEVSCPDVGGGFGAKNVTYPDYVLVLWAARRLGVPVHWIADRSEDFLTGVHGRDNHTRARLGLDAQGRFVALAVETVANLGAAASSLGPGPATTAPTPAVGGPYVIPAVSLDVTGAYTNTAPIDAYRGAGKPEQNYLMERLVDLAARRLGLDPADLRARNLVATTPHVTAMGSRIDSGDARDLLQRALLLADRAGFAGRRAESLRRGRLRGLGIGCFLETSRGQPGEEAALSLRPDGRLRLDLGTQSNGQGHETSFVQVLAARLGIPPESIDYRQADTAALGSGGGHGGARSLHMGGTAMLLAADDLVARARPVAARLLQAAEDRVRYAEGAFRREASAPEPAATLTWAALAEASSELVSGHGRHGCDLYTFPMGCHVAEVEVDPETGAVALLRYTGVDDYGTLVNPLLAEGQVQGGIAQGVGQALMERAAYADDGQLLTATLLDYALPRATDLPPLDLAFVETPTSANPLGAKGAGQAGAMAAPQAVVNAVLDALAPSGVTTLDMPLTPERIWRALRDAPAPAEPAG